MEYQFPLTNSVEVSVNSNKILHIAELQRRYVANMLKKLELHIGVYREF